MRILHVNDIAGVGTTLTRELRRMGHDATLRRLRLVGGGAPTGIKILLSPVRLAELAAVQLESARGRFDIVHYHYAYVGALASLGRRTTAVHCHGTDVRAGLRDPLRRPLVLLALRSASLVLVATPDILPAVRAVRPDAVFLPDPVDTAAFRPLAREPDGTIRVLLISAPLAIKGIEHVAAAVRPLMGTPGIVVHAISRGPGDARRFRELGVPTLIPAVPHDRMPELISAYDIVVGQAAVGALGMSELEALACGRPVVAPFRYAAAYGSPPPLVGADVSDPGEATAEIRRLAADTDRREAIGRESRAWVERHHGARRIADRLVELYGDAIKRDALAVAAVRD